METLVERARSFAQKYHAKQMYGKKPYIYHLEMVANLTASLKLVCATESLTFNHELVAISYLHDILEDTEVTFEMLVERFGETIARAVEALSKDGSPQVEYFQKVAANSSARIVKMYDRLANMRESINDKRLAAKYVSEYNGFKYALYQGHLKGVWKDLDEANLDLISFLKSN